nr:SDR family oxidoreductase [Nostoc punctiforme]
MQHRYKLPQTSRSGGRHRRNGIAKSLRKYRKLWCEVAAGTCEEMTAAAAFLASDEAAYIIGQTLFVHGGLNLYADFRETWSA